MKQHCARLELGAEPSERSRTEMCPSFPAPKFFLFPRLGSSALKRRVWIESQTSPQICRVLPRPLFSQTCPANLFWNCPPKPGRPGPPSQAQQEQGPSPQPACDPVCAVPRRPGLGRTSPGSKWAATRRETEGRRGPEGGSVRAGLGPVSVGGSSAPGSQPFQQAESTGSPEHPVIALSSSPGPRRRAQSPGSRHLPGSTRSCSRVSFFISGEDKSSSEPAGLFCRDLN